jgi:hypothetical protein
MSNGRATQPSPAPAFEREQGQRSADATRNIQIGLIEFSGGLYDGHSSLNIFIFLWKNIWR